jgi:hypothetical protein
LIIDNAELYHIGASLKDLGKKWFAFSRMDIEVGRMLQILNKPKKPLNFQRFFIVHYAKSCLSKPNPATSSKALIYLL